MVMVSNVDKEKGTNKYMFEILFEEALNPKPFWIPEETFKFLNSLLNEKLEHNMVKFYNVP